jgi:hypothetical protein
LKVIKGAVDSELFAGLSEAPANLPSPFESHCFHAANRNVRSSNLKYFMRLTPIGGAYFDFWQLPIPELCDRSFVSLRAAAVRNLRGKSDSERFRFGRRRDVPQASRTGRR